MDALISTLLLVILIGLPFYNLAQYRSERRIRARGWGALASALGLRYTPLSFFSEDGVVEGVYRGVRVVIDGLSYASRRERERTYVYTHFSRRMPAGLKIYADRSIFSGVGKRLGAQDIEVGAPTFDRAFMIKGADEAAVRALLTPTVRGVLLRYPRASTLRVNEDCVVDVLPGIVQDVERIQQVLDEQRAVVEALSGGR